MRCVPLARAALFAALMLLASWSAVVPELGETGVDHAVGRASGIDVYPSGFDLEYTSSSDESKYRLLSSHDPSGAGFSRPVDLYVIDGMLNKSQRISVTISNQGNTASGGFTLRIVVQHNEYEDFEILNTSVNVPSIAASDSATVSHVWVPHYGGNHTLIATTLHPTDDNTGNDARSRHLTIGQLYDNCDSQGLWSFDPNWMVDSAATLSGEAFHVGTAGSSSTYGASWDKSLTSPVLDMGNAHPNPNTYPKLGFFYTGSVGDANDGILIEWGGAGSWSNTHGGGLSFTGSPDDDLTDGTSWVISNEVNSPSGGFMTPGFAVPANLLSFQTQFRMRFLSDATSHGAGYWIEDIVFVYDEVVWPEEFGVSLSKGLDGHARRGHWSDHQLTITNDGNLTDEFLPTVSGLPAGWDSQFVHMSGSTILPGMTLQLDPGQTLAFRVQIKPAAGAPTGSQTATVTVTSQQNQPTTASVQVTTIVDPDYIPEWQPSSSSFYCLPGDVCEFSVNLTNAGDGSDTFVLTTADIITWDNWSFTISGNQQTSVTLPPQVTATVLLAASIPASALPGQQAVIDLIATSQADSSVTDSIRLNLTASMVSDASVGVDPSNIPVGGWLVDPGESVEVPFTVWNNASSQDTFAFTLEESGMRGWNISLPMMTTLVVRSGESGQLMVTVTAPLNAQAGDPAPILLPTAISQISGYEAASTSFSGVRVVMNHDLMLTPIDIPTEVEPSGNTAFRFEVENGGNGPDHVVVSVSGLPLGWNWWLLLEGVNLSGPISLSPEYEGLHVAQFDVVIQVPGSEDASQSFELTVSIAPMEGSDNNQSDNSHTFEILTKRVVRPWLTELEESHLNVRTDSMHVLGLSVRNDGNAYDGELRIRVTADILHPGVHATISNGGLTMNLGEWMATPLPPQRDMSLVAIITIGWDVPVGTQITFNFTLEGGADEAGEPQVVVRTLTVAVAWHRDLAFEHSLDASEPISPGQRMLFKVNVTSHSSFTEELKFKFDDASLWSVTCSQPEVAGGWILVIPAASAEIPRELKWDCELTAPDDPPLNPMLMTVHDGDGEQVWGHSVLMVLDIPVEEPDEFVVFGYVIPEADMPIVAAAVGLLFMIFIVSMVALIQRRRRRYDDEYYDDEDEDEVEQAPAEQQVQAVAPQAQAQPEEQQQAGAGTVQQAQAQQWTDQQVHEWQQQQAAQHAQVLDQQTARPAGQSDLQGAFGSLGVSETQRAEEESMSMDPTKAAELLGKGEVETTEPQQEDDSVTDSEGAQEPSASETEQEGEEPRAAEPSLPAVDCAFCSATLTHEDQWSECPDCGVYAHAACQEGQVVCARCGSRM